MLDKIDLLLFRLFLYIKLKVRTKVYIDCNTLIFEMEYKNTIYKQYDYDKSCKKDIVRWLKSVRKYK